MRANEITVVKNNRLTENESEKYRGEHRAPCKGSGAPLHDLTSVTETKQNLDEISTISSFEPSAGDFVLSSADERRIKNKMKPLPGGSGYAYVIENYGREVSISIVDPKNLTYSVGNLDIAKFPVNISNEEIFQVVMIKVHPEHRGRGIAKALYGLVLLPKPIGLGATLISDSTQSPAGIQNWVSLSKIPGVEVTGLVRIINYEDEFHIRSKDYDKLLNNLFGKIGGFLYGEQKSFYYYYQIPIELVGSKLENVVKNSLIKIYHSTKPTSISNYYKSFLMAKYDNDNQEMSEDTVNEVRKRKQKKAKLARVYGAVSYNFDSGDGGGIEESLSEAPIADYETLGDFSDTSKAHSFRQAVDRKLVSSPAQISKAYHFFERTPFNFRMFFANIKGLGKYQETGVNELAVDSDVAKVLGPEYTEKIKADSAGKITVIFTGNFGVDRIPLTPWMMAHRFGHAIAISDRWGKKSDIRPKWKNLENDFFRSINDILSEVYNVTMPGPYKRVGNVINYIVPSATAQYNSLFNAIGYQRSSEHDRINRPYEFLYELFAQYINSGEVKFKSLPQMIRYGRPVFGNRPNTLRMTQNTEPEDHQYYLNDLTTLMEQHFNEMLETCVGHIFVM